jgi:hypothetical protein
MTAHLSAAEYASSTALMRNGIKTDARGQEFVRLANALSALYPAGSSEKRLLDAMRLAVPR